MRNERRIVITRNRLSIANFFDYLTAERAK